MDHQVGDQDSTAPFCTFTFFDCLSTKPNDARPKVSSHQGVEREMKVLYHQPHLVEPMKLRVYEDLPATPLASEFTHLSQWSRNLASRASSRASRMSLRRRTMSKSIISKPLPMASPTTDLPLRRRREFTPLQLSIYEPVNRLSPLPEFDRLSFTDIGELKRPPRALIRTQSETVLQTYSPVADVPKRTLSMLITTENIVSRPETSYSIISTSRPPSEYDALHSHPVSWASLPGIPVQKAHKNEGSFAILTPMQEEFSPITATIDVDGTTLKFPRDIRPVQAVAAPAPIPDDTPSESPAPFPVVSRGPSDSSPTPKKNAVRPYFHTNYQTQRRISQWLHSRTQSSTSITSSFSGGSFAEHRRKRSEFYKLGQIQLASSPPQPLNIAKPVHSRSNTQSTAQSTVGTSVLSSGFNSRRNSDSATTLTFEHSRTGTMKSVLSPIGFKIVSPGDKDLVIPPVYPEIVDEELYLDEIRGSLRSPGVGVAF